FLLEFATTCWRNQILRHADGRVFPAGSGVAFVQDFFQKQPRRWSCKARSGIRPESDQAGKCVERHLSAADLGECSDNAAYDHRRKAFGTDAKADQAAIRKNFRMENVNNGGTRLFVARFAE